MDLSAYLLLQQQAAYARKEAIQRISEAARDKNQFSVLCHEEDGVIAVINDLSSACVDKINEDEIYSKYLQEQFIKLNTSVKEYHSPHVPKEPEETWGFQFKEQLEEIKIPLDEW